jgi:signal peptidase complex subunit 1
MLTQILSFVVGFVLGSVQVTVYVLGAGTMLTFLVCVPPWPMYKKHQLKFQSKVHVRQEQERPWHKKILGFLF